VIPPQDTAAIADGLWDVLTKLKGSDAKAKLVASSKILHHLLLELVPPGRLSAAIIQISCRLCDEAGRRVKVPGTVHLGPPSFKLRSSGF
jgi:hypothetical protein